jgi:cytochrome c
VPTPAPDAAKAYRLAADSTAEAPYAFRGCRACHTHAKGKPHGTGPNLCGIRGRRVGTAPDFSYSSAARKAGFVWDDAWLRELLRNPKAFRGHLKKFLHKWRPGPKESFEDPLMEFFRRISP